MGRVDPSFRAQTSAAPLKHGPVHGSRPDHATFPRSDERGPIEALRCVQEQYSPTKLPCLYERGPIEAVTSELQGL